MAEATGLTEAEVVAQIRQIRAETAFTEPKAAPAPSPLPWIAAGAFVVAIGVTAWRISQGDGMPSFKPEPHQVGPPVATTTTTVTRASETTTSMMMTDVSNTALRPPPGFSVHAMGQRIDCMTGSSYDPDKIALPYDRVLRELSASAVAVAEAVQSTDQNPPFPLPPLSPGVRIRDSQGNIYTPRPGFTRVVIDGWAGTGSEWVSVPLTAEGRKALDSLAHRVLEDVRKEQADALAPVADPSQGLVTPPPGFSFRFAGRRLDLQEGPHISFAGVPKSLFVNRLTAALMNAVHRDRRPPIGPWTGDPGKDAKIPIPSQSHVEILGPESLDSADIPTDPGNEAATRKAIEAFADKVAGQIDVINLKASKYDGKPRP